VRRKDFDDKAYSGFHAGYADNDRGYEIYIPELDKIVTSVHVLFNEVIPNPTDEYYRELQRLNVVTAEGSPRDPATYQYLVGLDHLDDEDGLTYNKVIRIDKVKGYIVTYRRLVTPRASDTREELVPIHIADIYRMTDDLVQSRKASTATPDERQQTGAKRSGPSSTHFSMIAAAGDSFITHLGVLPYCVATSSSRKRSTLGKWCVTKPGWLLTGVDSAKA
jgi:hypothetical protein